MGAIVFALAVGGFVLLAAAVFEPALKRRFDE